MNAITARIKKADPLFVPHLIRCGEWEAYYEGLLASLGTSRVVFVDFDLTAFERDALRALNEGYSQIDSRFGVPRWRIFERAYLEGGAKIDGEFRSLSGGEHLQIAYADLLRRTSLDDLVAYAAGNVPLVPGFKDFVRRLRRQGIAVVGITHGVWQIAQAVLSENGLGDLPFMANWIDEEKMEVVLVDESDGGLDKGRLVRLAHQLGLRPIAVIGDSKGDAGMARAVLELPEPGLVMARGQQCGLAAWCRAYAPSQRWILVERFDRPVKAGVDRADLLAADVIEQFLGGQ